MIPREGTKFEGALPQSLVYLYNQGYIKFEKYKLAVCLGRHSVNLGNQLIGCGNEIVYPLRPKDELIHCENCGNEYENNELSEIEKIIIELSHIKYEKLFKDTLDKITESGLYVQPFDRYGNYVIVFEDKRYLIVMDCIPSDTRAILSALESKEYILLIKFADFNNVPLPENLITFSGLEILEKGFEDKKYVLRDLPSSGSVIERLEEVSRVEKEILGKSKSLTWQALENEVSSFFIEEIRKREVQRYRYKTLVNHFPIYSRISVNAAGAGNPDKFTIEMADYLAEFFEAPFTFDAKCYTTTAVNSETMEKVLHHLSKDGFDAKRVIIIATTNIVTCWQDVVSYKKATGQYRLLIFNARLLSEVLVQLGFSSEFLRILDDCINKNT